MIASGAASVIAARTASASNTSQTTGSAPNASSCAARSTERVIAVTSCPAFNSCGTSGLPMTPVAPARNTRIASASLPQDGAKGGPIGRVRKRGTKFLAVADIELAEHLAQVVLD